DAEHREGDHRRRCSAAGSAHRDVHTTGGSLVHLRPGHNSSFSAAAGRPSWAVGTPASVGDVPRSLLSGGVPTAYPSSRCVKAGLLPSPIYVRGRGSDERSGSSLAPSSRGPAGDSADKGTELRGHHSE